jgi:hypothetical protein
LNRVNELEPENRDNRQREYVLLNEWSFYTFKNNNWNILEMLNYTKLNETKNTLF